MPIEGAHPQHGTYLRERVGSGPLPGEYISVQSAELLDYLEDHPAYCKQCEHFNPLGELGEPCEHGV